jgi:pyruvate dehydrogenase E2 component (dihydrolipoamide acetyltransferase)
MTIVRMPEVATGTGSAAIQTWLVAVGDPISAGQAIVEIETEKAVVDYEVDIDGVFAGMLLAEGESADVGTPIAVVAVGGQSIEDAMREAGPEAAAAPKPSDAGSAVQSQPEEAESADEQEAMPAVQPAAAAAGPAAAAAAADDGRAQSRRQFMSPLVRRLAREQGIDLTDVVGSGPNGRIVRRDLEQFQSTQGATASSAVQTALPSSSPPSAGVGRPDAAGPSQGSSSFVEIPHTPMRRAIARRLAESKATVPHFYLAADCRVDDLLDLRSQLNELGTAKISVNDLVVKAAAWALKDVPEANATWTDDAIRQYDHVDVSVAVALPTGLITPVLRGVDQMSISEVSGGIRDLAERAREGRLKQHEIEGGSFSVSNLGMYGVGDFSAIINPPQAGILAVGAANRQPVVYDGDLIRVATVMTVTLSADHRVIDGAIGARWLEAFTKRIEHPISIVV